MEIAVPQQVYRTFARNIKMLRKALGFKTVRQFEEHTGVPRETLNKYEQGKRIPLLWSHEIQLIAQMTGATADWLCYTREDTLPSELRGKLAAYQREQQSLEGDDGQGAG